MSSRISAFCLALCLAATSAFGQKPQVGPAVAVLSSPDPDAAYMEPVVAASPLYPNELVAGAIIRYVAQNGTVTAAISYGISVDGGATFQTTGLLHPQSCLPQWAGGDPMVAVAPNGMLFLGGLTRHETSSGCYVAGRRPNELLLEPVATAFCVPGTTGATFDKGLMAFGPADGTGRLLIAITTADPCGRMVGKRSDDATGSSWLSPQFDIEPGTPLNPCDIYGFGANPVILPNGRTIIAFLDQLETNGHFSVRYTRKDPSDPNWSAATDINFELGSQRIFPIDSSVLPGDFLAASLPSIAFDPGNSQRVYVAFAGVLDGSSDVDIYIAQSLNGGTTFLQDNILRLTNTQLGGTDQFMPAITVDQYGAVNLLYYRTSTADHVASEDAMLQAAYARIPIFGVPLVGNPFVRALSVEFRARVAPMLAPAPDVIGEYQWIVAAGCNVYVCYMSTLDPYLDIVRYNYFVHKIRVCPTDLNVNGFNDSGDPAAFASAYMTGSPQADLNDDQVSDAEDIALFQQIYTCGCIPP